MTDPISAQKRPNAPFFGTASLSSLLAFNPPANSPAGAVIEQELGVNLGGRYEPKLKKPRKYKFQIEPRFFNFGMRFPAAFRKPNFFSFTTGLWFRFSFKEDRVGLVPWVQAGAVRRNFTVEKLAPASEEGVDPSLPPPSPEECEEATVDNPFGGDCSEDAPPLVPTRVDEYRTGVDAIVGISGSVQAFKGKAKRDLLTFNFSAWNRLQYVPHEPASLRDSIRVFVGASTGFHPKVAPFLSLGFMAGPEFNFINQQVTFFFQPVLRANFDVSPRGF